MGRAKDVLRQALEPDAAEQAEVLEALWENATGGQLGTEWEREIERRIDEVDAGRMATEPGDEVMARLRQRHRGGA